MATTDKERKQFHGFAGLASTPPATTGTPGQASRARWQ